MSAWASLSPLGGNAPTAGNSANRSFDPTEFSCTPSLRSFTAHATANAEWQSEDRVQDIDAVDGVWRMVSADADDSSIDLAAGTDAVSQATTRRNMRDEYEGTQFFSKGCKEGNNHSASIRSSALLPDEAKSWMVSAPACILLQKNDASAICDTYVSVPIGQVPRNLVLHSDSNQPVRLGGYLHLHEASEANIVWITSTEIKPDYDCPDSDFTCHRSTTPVCIPGAVQTPTLEPMMHGIAPMHDMVMHYTAPDQPGAGLHAMPNLLHNPAAASTHITSASLPAAQGPGAAETRASNSTSDFSGAWAQGRRLEALEDGSVKRALLACHLGEADLVYTDGRPSVMAELIRAMWIVNVQRWVGWCCH